MNDRFQRAAAAFVLLSSQNVMGARTVAAQTAAQTSRVGASKIEEVIVTAERKTTKLSRTPVSITALGTAALARQGVHTERDLQSAVAGLTVRATAGSNELNYALRGQSVDSFTNSRPGVQPYLDEIAVLPNGGSTAFYDLQSVQVLKGPQGTLFGRNSTGGAVLFTSAQPSDRFGGYVTSRVGDFGLAATEGAVNIPILSDRIDLRIAGYDENRNGYQTNTFNDTHPGTIRQAAGRVTLRIKLNDALTDTTTVDVGHFGGSNASVLYAVYPPGSTNNGIPLNATAASFYSPLLDQAIGFPGAWDAYLAAHPGVPSGGIQAYLAQQQAAGNYKVQFDGQDDHRADNLLVSNVTAYDVSADTHVKNIFGYAHSNSQDLLDEDDSPFGVENAGVADRESEFTEELQVLGKALNEHLSYVAGFYYAHEKDIIETSATVFNVTPIIQPEKVSYLSQAGNSSYAGYAQGTYDLAGLTGIQGLGATAGVRYTGENVSSRQLPTSVYFNFPGAPAELTKSYQKLSWQFGVQDQIDPAVLLYVVSRHSFRSGGYNAFAPPLPQSSASGGALFYPETATDIEGGAKFLGNALGTPVSLNVAVYNLWIDNAQREVNVLFDGSPAAYTGSVPQAQVTGAELDGQIRPLSWLNLGGAFAWTDGRFTKPTTVLLGQSATFGPYSDAPKFAGSVFAEASFGLPRSLGTLTLRGDEYAQSSFYFGALGNTIIPDVKLPGYAITNFRVGLDEIAGTRFSLAGYVRNAFDRAYYVGGVAEGATAGINLAVPGEPRMFYVEGTYKF